MSSIAVAVAIAWVLWLAARPPPWPWRLVADQPVADRPVVDQPVADQPASGPPTRRIERITDDVPRTADLLAVALSAGASVPIAISEVGERDDAPAAVRAAATSLQRGNPVSDVLEELAGTNHAWHGLATVLSLSVDAGRGAPEGLRRFASGERLRARRDRERRARRLPVLLLLPLTTMVLPAFVLATVVPFLVLGENPLRLPPPIEVPEGP